MTPEQLYFHHMLEELNSFKESKRRVVHYTSATVLLSILRNKEVWLRSTTLMNDYDEIERGIRAVAKFFALNADSSTPFWSLLDACYSDVSKEIIESYDKSLMDLRNNTFVMSLSQHLDKEDKIGRLSMWRAYAPKDGIALVLSPDIFFREENKLNVFSYPALYWTDDEIEAKFTETIIWFEEHKAILKSHSKENIVWYVVEMLVSYAICLKHPGFQEEREIRIVYRPNQMPSKVTQKEVVSIGTSPQIIHKIPLNEAYDTDMNEILDHVIVGPSQSNIEISNAILEVMVAEGIKDVGSKIKLSDIPLRT